MNECRMLKSQKKTFQIFQNTVTLLLKFVEYRCEKYLHTYRCLGYFLFTNVAY